MRILGLRLASAGIGCLEEMTNTVHPPGGATALLFEIVPTLHQYQFAYATRPLQAGVGLYV